MTAATLAPPSGPVRFARFAFPPNRLGYCGPGTDGELAHYAAGHEDPGLREMAADFEGAYPYLQLLAGSNRRADPLDSEVVEAYWLGNELLQRVSREDFGRSIDHRFRRRAGSSWRAIEGAIPVGVANHSFHVLHVMPWAGLLRDGIVDEPLRIVDRCRISWAEVLASDCGDGRVLVRRAPLVWAGSRLQYGTPVIEPVDSQIVVEPGDVVAVHWDWICERLDARRLGWLRRVTDEQLNDLRAG
ncbi:MAG: DUF6390 family protein [Ilumatobacteraceae bacterium]